MQIGGDVVLAPPCSCGANLDLIEHPVGDPVWRRIWKRRQIGCPEHALAPLPVVGPDWLFVPLATWYPASWVSRPRWPFRWPWRFAR